MPRQLGILAMSGDFEYLIGINFRGDGKDRITLHVCAVHRRMFTTIGVIMSTVRETVSTPGGVQYTGRYREYTRGLP